MTPNQGQWDERIDFSVPIQSGKLYIENDGLTFWLFEHADPHDGKIKPSQTSYQGIFQNLSTAIPLSQKREGKLPNITPIFSSVQIAVNGNTTFTIIKKSFTKNCTQELTYFIQALKINFHTVLKCIQMDKQHKLN